MKALLGTWWCMYTLYAIQPVSWMYERWFLSFMTMVTSGILQILQCINIYCNIKHYNLHHLLITISKPSSVNLMIISNILELKSYLIFNDKKIISQRMVVLMSIWKNTLIWTRVWSMDPFSVKSVVIDLLDVEDLALLIDDINLLKGEGG